MNIDTDLEIERYQEATDMLSHAFNPEELVGLPRQYNPLSRRNRIMQELPSGGFVQVGEEDLPQPQAMTAAPQQPSVEPPQAPSDLSDITPELVEKFGYFQEYDPTIREDLHFNLKEALMNLGQYIGFIPGIPTNVEFQNFKISEPVAEQLAGFVSGKNNLGVGAGDFVGLGSMAVQEGYRAYQQGDQTGDNVMRALGAVEMGLGLAEAVPAAKPLSKGIKEGLRVVRQRLNQPGPMPTVGSNLGNVGQFKIEKDEVRKILDLRAVQMELPVSERVQPSNNKFFETGNEAYTKTLPEQKETPVPRAPDDKTLPLGDRSRAVIEMSDEIANVLAKRAKQFVGTNVQYFYHTGPIIDKAIELGFTKEQAFDRLKNFAKNYAATSPRTKTEDNLRNASLAITKQGKGIDIDQIIGVGGDGINEKGYPMIINPGGIHRKLLDAITADGISFNTNPKPATFAENVAGNLAGVTVDTHAIRAVFSAMNEIKPGSVPIKFIGGKTAAKTKEFQEAYKKDPSSLDVATMINDTLQTQKINGETLQTEYAVFSDLYKLVAKKLGVQPAEAQSLSWFANGKMTGLASEPKTIVELIDDRVDVTAQLSGLTKREVFKKFFQGSLPLLSLGPITLLETGSSFENGLEM